MNPPNCIGILTGSGQNFLKALFQDHIQDSIPYSTLFEMEKEPIPGHEGTLYKCMLNRTVFYLWNGRFHYYEGLSLRQVIAPILLGESMGIKTWIILNAAGAINPTLHPGDIMIITSHLYFLPDHPFHLLLHSNVHNKPNQIYDQELTDLAMKIGTAFDIKTGTYACMPGPSLETKAECRFLRKIGADAVGMSTIPEVLTAAYLGHRVLAISFIANHATDLSQKPLSHDEVLKQINKMKAKALQFMERLTRSLCSE